MKNLWIPESAFSNNRDDLVLQIRWLLNEMSASLNSIELGDLEEAKKILRLEVEDNLFITMTTKGR